MDIKALLEGIEKLLNYMFGGKPPEWLLPVIAWCIGIGFVLWGVVFLLAQLQKIWAEFIQPKFYNPDDKRRRSRRQMFADFMEAEIRRLNSLEAWNDNRFAELEAEVEAEGGRKLFDMIKIRFSASANLRKEKSLSKALERSTERLILVEGDPGSGKSVALRHLAQGMSRKAGSSRSLQTVIPLYINLKYLRRLPGQVIDQKMIQEFVLKTLNRINDRDVEDFLVEEFKQGLEDGTWLFLFDSFDEVPDILSSTEADNVVREYAEAISDFLHRMNKCRGIVASREYKGPRFLGWPKFRVLPLTLDRKLELIKRTGLRLEVQKDIINGISQSTTDFKYLTGNPMFLNLLCEFMNKKEIPEFPQHTHHVFNDYVWKRLQHDEERLQQRFSKTPAEIRSAAEKLAFCMTADINIGLSPTIDQLEDSTQKLGLSLGADFSNFVNAIEYLKLARIETSIQDGNEYFTFAHRRFQEYFATAVVLREPDRVENSSLLRDARWRETAVVIFQTQSLDAITPLFAEVQKMLTDNSKEFHEKNKNELEDKSSVALPRYSLGKLGKRLFESYKTSRANIEWFIDATAKFISRNEEEDRINLPLHWPKNLFHLLGILQEGLSTKYEVIPDDIRRAIDALVANIMQMGSLDDRKWALDVAGCASLEVVEKAIDIGFSSPGTWVKNPAILQVSRLPQIPKKFSKHIISNLLMSAQEQFLLNRRHEIYAQFSRFADEGYLNAASLIVWMPFIDFSLIVLGFMLVVNLIKYLISTVQGGAALISSLVFVLFLSVLGVLVRWRSSSILKSISDTYSSRFSDNYSRYSEWFTKRFRVKQPKRSDKSLSEKLMSLMMGIIFSVGGVLLLIFASFTSNMPFDDIYFWGTIIVFSSLQLWSLTAILEVFQIKRTARVWQVLYLFYPLVLAAVFPLFVGVYLIDHLYLISRFGVAVNVLKKSEIRHKFIPFIYRGNYYAEIWMPLSLTLILAILIKLMSLASMAALWLVLILIAFELFALVYLFLMPILAIFREKARHKDARRNIKQLDSASFVSMIEGFKTKRYRLDLMRAVLEKQYLSPTPPNVARLRILIAFIQTILASQYTAQNFKRLVEIDKDLASALGYVNEENYKVVNHWDEDQLDLLCKLLEQLQQASAKSI